jgi:hypothetical protein
LFSSSPQTVDVPCKTIRLSLAVDLLHVMYIEYKQILVSIFLFNLLCTGRRSTVSSVVFTVPFAKVDTAA